MNAVTIHIHLAIPTVVAIIGIVCVIIFRRRLSKSVFIGTLTFLVFYGFVVGFATYEDIYSQWQLNQFDLNNDGFFTGKERTAKQKAAMLEVISDTARNFSFITGGIAAFILGLASYAFSRVYELIKSKLWN